MHTQATSWIQTPPSDTLRPGAEARLQRFLDDIGELLGNKRRREAFALYACGLVGDGERKSVEPVAVRACGRPDQAEAMHAKLLHFLGRSPWRDAPVREYAAVYGLRAMQRHGVIQHWIIDDTGMLKQGKHSPGVQRQYTGSAGKVCNCQVAVSLTVATALAHLPIDFRLYLPESWAEDRERCRKVKIPDDIGYSPKWQLALQMVDAALAADVPPGVVLADSDYGNKSEFRAGLVARDLVYAVDVQSPTTVRRVRGKGPRRRVGPRMSVYELAYTIKPSEIRTITWREGSKHPLRSQFAVLRVEPAHDDDSREAEQWLVIEWPDGEHKPAKFALSTLPRDCSRKHVVRTWKERWRTERVYEDLKGQLGLDHFEGRSFTGWHHHVTVALCCFAFLVAEQARSFPPSAAWARPPATYADQARAALP